MLALLGLTLGVGGLLLYLSTQTKGVNRAERTGRFRDALNQAFLALDRDDMPAYRAALAAASAQLDVSKGPTLRAEEPLAHYQSILYAPQDSNPREILSFAGTLQAQGHDFEAGNLLLLEMNLVR